MFTIPRISPQRGNKTTIYQTARRAYFVDEYLQIYEIYNGSLPPEMQHLIQDIEILKTEN